MSNYGGGDTSGGGSDQSKLESLAPLTPPTDEAPAVTGTVTITWYAVFKPEAPEAAPGTEGQK